MSRELVARPTGVGHHVGVRQGHTDTCPACQLDELGGEYKAWFAANHYTPAHEFTARALRLFDARPPAEVPLPVEVPPVQGPQPPPVVDWKALRKSSQLQRCESCRWYVRRAAKSGLRERCRCGRWHEPPRNWS